MNEKPKIPSACTSCRGTPLPLSQEEARAFMSEVPEWQLLDDGKTISRTFVCKDHKDAMTFITTVAEIADAQDHHPDHHLTKYKRVAFALTTHSADGLTTNDFVVAHLIDQAWDART